MKLKFAIALGWASRGLGMVLMIVNTRLLMQLVGVRGFAAQSIVGSLITWLALFNLGVPSSMQNLISRWRTKGITLHVVRQTAASLTGILGLLLLPLVLLAAYLVQKYLLTEYPFVSYWAVSTALICMFIGGLGTVYMSILYAEHRGIWPNMYPAITTTLVFIALSVCKSLGKPDFNFILAVYFLPNALFAVLAFMLLRLKLRIDPQLSHLREIMRGAWGFSLIAAMGAMILSVDYIILSRILPADEVAAYSLTSKVFLVIQALHAVVLNSAWTSLSDLFFSHNLEAARRRAVQLSLLGVTLSALWSAVVVAEHSRIYSLLAPGSTIEVSPGFLALWVVYIVVRTWCDSFYIVLQSFGDTAALTRYMFFQAPIGVGLQWILGAHFGMGGVVLGIALSFVLTCGWYLPMRTFALTRVH